MTKTIYFRRDGKVLKEKMEDLRNDIKQQLEEVGLPVLREMVNADKNSPFMVVVK